MKKRMLQLLIALLITATSLFGVDVTGIWVGTQQGRRGEPEDISFRFRFQNGTLSGKLFGDELKTNGRADGPRAARAGEACDAGRPVV